jgi:hypothetical protein
MLLDLADAIESGDFADSDIAPIVLRQCLRNPRLRTNESYSFHNLRIAIHDADESYARGDDEYPHTTGHLFKLRAAAVICTALCAVLKPGRALHELALAVCREVLPYEGARIDLEIDQAESQDLYEAGLHKDAQAVYGILEALYIDGNE